ncbi:MAG: HAD family hydrolase [Beijerinckiaceae bacterium]
MTNGLPHVVFDLDDTLYSEVTYVHSALQFVGEITDRAYGQRNSGAELLRSYEAGDRNPIQTYWQNHELPKVALPDCVSAMRAHYPSISLREGARFVLSGLERRGIHWSILTDGRSVTQRQKLAALGLIHEAHGIYISEERNVSKPHPSAFKQIERDFAVASHFVYVADNPQKDFISPKQRGWITLMLGNDGRNLHAQDADLPIEMQAGITIANISDTMHHLEVR